MADWNTQDGDGTMPIYKSLVRKVSIPAQSKIKQKDYLPKGAYPVIDQGQELIGGYTDDPSKLVRCRLPVIVFGDHTKAVKYITFPFAAGADGIKVLEVTEGIDPRFLFYATKYLTYKIENKGYARHYQFVEKKDISIPELPEQQRIVGRIEELFSQLDDAEATLQKTKAQLSVYRQAVLHNAFQPTKNSREVTVADIGEINLGRQRSPKNVSKNYPTKYIRAANITESGIDISDVLEMEFTPSEREKYYLRNGDIVLSEASGSTSQVGKPAIWKCQIPDCCFQNTVIRHRVVSESPEYIYWYYKYLYETGFFATIVGGVGINHLGAKNFSDVKLFLAPREWQPRIVEQVESQLSVFEDIYNAIKNVEYQAKALRQSILKLFFVR